MENVLSKLMFEIDSEENVVEVEITEDIFKDDESGIIKKMKDSKIKESFG